ncbi:MAG TPA: hypothetical protein VFN35_12810 [Ktedonobacteraceae bacterium]|nr:hypothetical protein [Ktedonobacteraceae bacterium]
MSSPASLRENGIGVVLSFLHHPLLLQRERLFRHWYPRLNWRLAQTKLSISRLRQALSQL